MKLFTSYVVTERGAKVAPLPKFVLRFYAILILGTGAFLVFEVHSWAIRIGLGLGLLVLPALAEWEARSTIEFTEEGILLRNGWRKKTIAWSRFDRFAVPTPPVWVSRWAHRHHRGGLDRQSTPEGDPRAGPRRELR
jgi:hypothetical protein